MRPGLTVHAGGHVVDTWAESYEPADSTEVLVTYDDGPLAGQAAVVRNGQAYSIGAWSAALVESVLTEVLIDASVAVTLLPEGVRISRRGNSEIWMNFNQAPATLPDGSIIGPVSFQIRSLADRR